MFRTRFRFANVALHCDKRSAWYLLWTYIERKETGRVATKSGNLGRIRESFRVSYCFL